MERTTSLGALLLCIVCAGCARATADPSASPSPEPRVAVVRAAQGVVRPTLQIAGVITPFRQVGVAANLSEPIADVLVQEGDRVRAGQVLARLVTDDLEAQLASAQRVVGEDVARYQQAAYQTGAVSAQDEAAVRSAQASLRQAQVDLAGAQTDLKRYRTLASQGYVPQQTVEQQRTTVASDEAAVNAARAALNQALANARANGTGADAGAQQAQLTAARAAADAAQASVEQLRRQIARATIVAPVDGVVDAVNANPGEYPSGRQLFTIEAIDRVYAALPASSAQVLVVRPGAAATIASGGGVRRDRGTVAAVLDQVQPGTTNFTVKVLVANADAHLHAGMPVTGVVDEPVVRGIVVPVTAFVDDTRSTVYLVSNGVVRTQTVHEIVDDGKTAAIRGVPAGALVVKDASAAAVGNGDRVQVARS
ncbi:MAG TPA: efflux RND transporter periplasmic adaptor subunit [Candidatus Elarobacter sp.]|nr:efflux RND transporter periplasmic adaptor subunit [Candidatus Elarobacter sp.]